MKKIKTVFYFPILVLLISACGNDDIVKEISKDGAIETTIEVVHLDAGNDIINTIHNVWIKNQLVKTNVHSDTIPTLGSAIEDAENSNGETQKVVLRKDFEVFITVK